MEVGAIHTQGNTGEGLEAIEQGISLMCRKVWRVNLKERTEDFQNKYVKFRFSEDIQTDVLEIWTGSSEERSRLEI